jgi:hypothetical protein
MAALKEAEEEKRLAREQKRMEEKKGPSPE